MKRRNLMKRLAQIAKVQGVEMRVRKGGNHTKDWIANRSEMVPRHTEINEMTARPDFRSS